ncbi:MAG: type II secretion system protein GspN [Pseudobdellovibrionaceae bacterium]
MKYVNAIFGWMWRNKAFFATTLVSAVLFFAWMFPFTDLSDAVTSAIARGSNNAVYAQFDQLDLNVVPLVSVSATGVSADLMNLPTLNFKNLNLRPAWFSLLFSPLKVIKAARGDMEAQSYAAVLALSHVRLNGIFGGDISLDLSPDKVENGALTARTELELDSLDLNDVQDWANLPVKMKGKANADVSMKFDSTMQSQPEGEFSINVKKFSLPSSTVMIPMGEASMPVNLPTLTLANVVFKGRLVGGNLVLEEGQFGAGGDPVYGRIKGQIGIRFQNMGGQVIPQIGSYNFTVDMNSTKAIEKEIGIAFLLFDSAKTPTATGSHYLFRASGQGVGGVPSITRLSSF